MLDRTIVHVPDVLADPEYSRELALAGGWRAVLAVPLLRDGEPVGAVSVAKAEPTPLAAFVQGLRQRGWTKGTNIQIDIRWARAMPSAFA